MVEKKKKNVIIMPMTVNVNFAAGLSVGFISGVGFHPLDRALYLRGTEKLKERQHLFAPKYWSNPMSGLRNTIYQRIFSNGIYFTMQGELNTRLYPVMKNEWQVSDNLSKPCIGLIAGAVTGFFSNASYAVKFYTFTYKPNGRPLENAMEMWRRGGYKPFFKGIYAGVARDAIFGVFYETTNFLLDNYCVKELQNKIPQEYNKTKDALYFSTRFFSATLATIMSSPLNYARNIQFKTAPHKPQPLILDIWSDVWRESNKALKKAEIASHTNRNRNTIFSCPRLKFFQNKFMIGAGTARAGLGMALGQLLFNNMSNSVQKLDDPRLHKIFEEDNKFTM